MFEIKGKYSTAVCYASLIEEEAVGQIQRMCSYEFTEGSRIAIMPDAHAGAGCTIGTTMTVGGMAVPNVVGVDIGCGMYTVRLAEKEIDFERLDAAAHYIPSGFDVWEHPIEKFDLGELRCVKALKRAQRHECSLGTLGGGNHFIEADRSEDGALWLVIHSGSRNLGKQVAEHYQKLAVKLHSGHDEFMAERAAIVERYRAEGRQSELQQALAEHARTRRRSTVPDDICWLYGAPFEDYLADVAVCQRFARRSRELMAQILLERAGLTAVESFHTIHNYIDTENMILRKGAISAQKGERVLIPINMRDGSILAVGRGNPDWNFSAPHGAGRVLSRSAAKERITLEEYEESMRGIYTTSVGLSTIDESPMAYKPLADIEADIRESVDVLEIIRPIYNFKAG